MLPMCILIESVVKPLVELLAELLAEPLVKLLAVSIGLILIGDMMGDISIGDASIGGIFVALLNVSAIGSVCSIACADRPLKSVMA